MRAVKPWLFVPLALGLVHSPTLGVCTASMLISQATAEGANGNVWTDPGRSYGGWFWMAGRGNNLINANTNAAEAGTDSGLLGGSTTPQIAWLFDKLGDGSLRLVHSDWGNGGVDGCGDLNGNGWADGDEVLAVLVVDDRGEEFALVSVGGKGRGWDLSKVSNGIVSAYGGATNGVPMSAVPRPTLGTPRAAAGGRVDVDVTPPSLRSIPTYDDVGGTRPMVQGFHILQNDLLLAEIGAGGGTTAVKAAPGQDLVLRTIFGYPGDAGFYVDKAVRVPAAGEAPPPPEEPELTAEGGAEPAETGSDEDAGVAQPGGAAAAVVVTQAEPEEPATDGDEDGVFDDQDNCPQVANPEQEDMDQDAVGDFCDSCPFDANEDQVDGDDDGLGDTCDPCPADADNADGDGDGACDVDDNCPGLANSAQEDADGDGQGDACDDSFEPYVVTLELPGSAATRGAKVDVKLAVKNRGAAARKALVRLLWADAQGTETAVVAAPDCLEKVPLELDLPSGAAREWTCTWAVPSSLAAGKGRLRLELVDKQDEKLKESAESALALK